MSAAMMKTPLIESNAAANNAIRLFFMVMLLVREIYKTSQ
jgi:hypothetical protein